MLITLSELTSVTKGVILYSSGSSSGTLSKTVPSNVFIGMMGISSSNSSRLVLSKVGGSKKRLEPGKAGAAM